MRTTTEHNPPTASRIRRAAIRLALATTVSATAVVMATEVAHAGAHMALTGNHNEAAVVDGNRATATS